MHRIRLPAPAGLRREPPVPSHACSRHRLLGESPRVRCNVVVHFKAAPIRVPEADQGYEVVFQVLFDRQLLDPAIPQDDELPYLSRGNTGYQRTADVDVRQRDRLHLSV